MTWLLHLFTTFDGRISRKDWWIGTVILLTFSVAVQLVVDPSAFSPQSTPPASPTLGQTLWSIALFVPGLALTLKRLNDRDHSRLLGYAWGVLGVATIIALHAGYFPSDFENYGHRELIRLLPSLLPPLLFQCWIFIDNGFLKGTQGPNRYGPDPLVPAAGGAPSGALPVVGRTRYTGGAFARDAIIGAVALVTGAYLFVPQVNFENTVGFLVRLSVGMDYEDFAAMKLVNRHLEQLDPVGERKQAELDEKMRAHAKAREDYDKGRSAAIGKKHAEAVRDFTLAIDRYGEQNTTAAPVLMRRGDSYRKLREPKKAFADYDAAIALQPDADNYYYDRANLHAELKQYQKALADYDAAIRVSRRPVAQYDIERGDMLHRLDKPEQSLASYEKAIERAREKYDRLAAIDRAMADLTFTERETFLAWAAKMRDRYIRRADVRRGIVLRDFERYDQAVWAFDKAIKLDPDAAYAYKQRGWVYEKQGRFEMALADYERASELNDASDWLKRATARVTARVKSKMR